MMLEKKMRKRGEELRKEQRKQDRFAAHHEAGHAVAAYAIGREIHSVTIDEGGGGASLHQSPIYGQMLEGEAAWNVIEEMVIAFAGPAAQRRVQPGCKVPSSDRETVEALLANAEGLTQSERERVLRQAKKEARKLIDRHWHQVEMVAAGLLEHRVLNDVEIAVLLQRRR